MNEFRKKWWPKSTDADFEKWEQTKDKPTCLLDEICQKYNCDKSNSQMVSKQYRNTSEDIEVKIQGHNYTEIYEKYFSSRRLEKLNILEIGIGNYPTNGQSMKAFLEYFPNAKLTYLDWSYSNFMFDFDFDKSRVSFVRLDQSNNTELFEFSNLQIEKFDFIIDDCSHQGEHQYNTLKFLFPKLLKDDGVYFIEDIHDSNFLSYLPKIYDNLNSGNVNYTSLYNEEDLGISKITMYRSLLCFEKGDKITR